MSKNGPVKTYYEILNVAPTSEDIVIRAAYRALMAKYHPDKYPGEKQFAERMARDVNEAYEILRDPKRRAEYDKNFKVRRDTHRESHNRASSESAGPADPISAVYGEVKPVWGNGYRNAWIALLVPMLVVVGVLSEQPEGAEAQPIDLPAAVPSSTAPAVVQDALGETLAPDAAKGSPPQETSWEADIAAADDVRADPLPPGFELVEPERTARHVAADEQARGHPDLSQMADEDASTIRIACVGERGDGPAIYNVCLRRHVSALASGATHPDFSKISGEDASTIRIACAGERGDGPAEYNRCLQRHLRDVMQ